MQRFKTKFILFLFGFMFIFFLTNDFGLVNVDKTAIVTAIAIDKGEEDKYLVSMQIALPQASDSSKGNSSAVVKAEGKTVASGINNIAAACGWYPNLVFCSVVVLGDEIVKSENVMNTLEYFLRSTSLPDSVLIATSETRGIETLQSKTSLDQISAFALLKIFVHETSHNNEVYESSLKDLSIGYYSKSQYMLIPQIKIIETDDNTKTEGAFSNSVATQGGEGGGSGDSGQGGENKSALYDASSTLIIDKNGKVKGALNKLQTRAFNLINFDFDNTYLEFPKINTEDYINLNIIKNKFKKSLKFINGEPTLVLDLKLYAKVEDKNSISSVEEITYKYIVPKDISESAEKYLKDIYTEMFNLSKSANCDFFEIKNMLFKYHPKKYGKYENNVLDKVKLKLNISVYGMKK